MEEMRNLMRMSLEENIVNVLLELTSRVGILYSYVAYEPDLRSDFNKILKWKQLDIPVEYEGIHSKLSAMLQKWENPLETTLDRRVWLQIAITRSLEQDGQIPPKYHSRLLEEPLLLAWLVVKHLCESQQPKCADNALLQAHLDAQVEKFHTFTSKWKHLHTSSGLYGHSRYDLLSVGLKHDKYPEDMAEHYHGEIILEKHPTMSLQELSDSTPVPMHEVLSVFHHMFIDGETSSPSYARGYELWEELIAWKKTIPIPEGQQFSLLHLSSVAAEMMQEPGDLKEIIRLLEENATPEHPSKELIHALSCGIRQSKNRDPVWLTRACDAVITFLQFDGVEREQFPSNKSIKYAQRRQAQRFFVECRGVLLAPGVALHVAGLLVRKGVSHKPHLSFIDFYHRVCLQIEATTKTTADTDDPVDRWVLKQQLYSTFVYMLLNDGLLNANYLQYAVGKDPLLERSLHYIAADTQANEAFFTGDNSFVDQVKTVLLPYSQSLALHLPSFLVDPATNTGPKRHIGQGGNAADSARVLFEGLSTQSGTID